jgi:lipid A ethanolaminephosphotransferase
MKSIFNKNPAKIKLWQVNIAMSLLLMVFYNKPFWLEIIRIVHPQQLTQYLFVASIFVLVTLIINLLLTLLCFKYSYKFIYTIILLGSSSALYFINQYNILIDSDMVQNVFETNSTEAFDFVNIKIFIYVVFMGFLPLILLFRLPLKFDTLLKAALQKVVLVIISVALIAILLFISYPNYASIARNERHLSHKIIPTNFIFATISYAKQSYKSNKLTLQKISQDAQLSSFWNQVENKTVTVLILGETARADHFGINGYEEQTTPLLAKRLANREIINFSQVSSCGTSTAVSLPCIYSYLVRDNYTKSKAKASENLLDFLLTTDFSVQWRDNNTGCKGICDRAEFMDLTMVKGNENCTKGECYDEILLSNLKQQILNNPKHQVIVLHQKGSHGPAYYLRYPAKFKMFTPTCDSNELQSCTQQAVINAYDNTITYTDYFIDKTIQLLDSLPENINTSMIYLSDHGESLGENNIYLHGTPYFMAPEAQTHVPMVFWLSKKTQKTFNIDYGCLQNLQNNTFSHDNYFQSVLGLLAVNTQYYDKDLDIFAQCKGFN